MLPSLAAAPVPLPPVLSCAAHGRRLGGVAAGIAARWELPVGRVRALWVLSALLFGVGLVAYAAAWLVLPTAQPDARPAIVGTAATLALGAAAVVGLGTIALLAGAATLFGFGWAVVVLAGAGLIGGLVAWPAGVRPAWVLLPLGATAVPAVAVAASGVRLDPQYGVELRRPLSARDIPGGGYRAGLGDLLVDLRALQLTPGSSVPVRVRTGLGETVVALPHDRCVNLDVHWSTGLAGIAPRAAPFGAGPVNSPLPTDDAAAASGPVRLFGRTMTSRSGHVIRPTTDPDAPTVRLDFSSVHGSLVLRDYPERTGPLNDTSWPASVAPPSFHGAYHPAGTGSPVPPASARSWRGYVRRRDAYAQQLTALRQGPCATPVGLVG